MAIDLPPAVETIVVQPARLPPAAGDAAFSIVEINADKLGAQPWLDEALTSTPGVSLFRRTSSLGANPTTQGISLRSVAGSGASRALVTLDGVPQNDPFGGWVIWSSLPSEIVEDVRIVRGAGAGPYGAGALTGVIALDEVTTVPGGFAGELAVGEMDYRRGAAVVDAGSGATRLVTSLTAQHSDGWIPIEARARGDADSPLALDAINGSARFQTEVGSAVVAVRASAYREKRDGGLRYVVSRSEGWSGSVTVASAPTDQALGWRVQGWIRESDLVNTSASVAAGRDVTTPANNQYATPATGYGFNAAVRRAAANYSWELGADLRFADGATNEMYSFMNGAFTRRRIAGGETFVGGAYAEASRSTGDWLFTGGVRLDRWKSYNGNRLETMIATGATILDDSPADKSGTVPTGRLGARLALANDMYWRSAAYAGFRPATLNELYRPFRVGNDITEANGGLKPERLFGIETGLGGKIYGEGTWNFGVFYNRLDDAIANVTIGQGPGTFPIAGFVPAGGALRQRQNAGAVNAIGFEFDAERPISDTLSVNVAAGLTRAKVDGGTAAPQLTGLRPAQTPRFTAQIGATWAPIAPLRVRLDARYEGARFDDDTNSRVLNEAVVFDARVDFKVRGPVAVYAAVENLFDTNVETAITGTGDRSFGTPQFFRVGLSVRR
jgi:outer membrane receptor protein involved in Fe transport